LLEYNDMLTTALRVKASADSAVAAVYKRAESAGLDRKTLKRAHNDALKAANERQTDEERYRLYMRWLSAPVDPDETVSDDPEDATEAGEAGNGADAEVIQKHENNVAFEEGVAAGTAGSPMSNCGYDVASEEYQSYSLGWSQGQKAAVEALGGATRRTHAAA